MKKKGNLLYSMYGSSGQWGLFDKQFGRSNAQESDPEGRVPDWSKASVQEMKDKFTTIGFGPRQHKVLLKLHFLLRLFENVVEIKKKGNMLYSAYGSSGQWGLFDKQFGRSNAQELDHEGRVPDWSIASVQEMKDKFTAIGFGPRQIKFVFIVFNTFS